jgi:hypothetical protein
LNLSALDGGRGRPYRGVMPKRSRRSEPDANEIAARIVDAATTSPGKDPIAVLLGRRGGVKGGKSRAEKLTPERRKEIARLGAAARWQKKAQA